MAPTLAVNVKRSSTKNNRTCINSQAGETPMERLVWEDFVGQSRFRAATGTVFPSRRDSPAPLPPRSQLNR